MKTMLGWMLGVVLVAGVTMAGDSPSVKRQTTCPVMGGTVKTNLYVDAEGKRIYVCCRGCLPEVKKDPAKYIAILEKSGVTLDKADAGSKQP